MADKDIAAIFLTLGSVFYAVFLANLYIDG